jgi:hypothetical protein
VGWVMSKVELLIYQGKDGLTQVSVRLQDETLWLSLMQLTELFQRDKSVISRHMANIFEEGELERDPTVALFATVLQEGKRRVKREVEHYNMDMIISVGYRVNSHVGVHFRRWATERLREFIIKGFVLDDARLKQARDGYFDELLGRIRDIAPSLERFGGMRPQQRKRYSTERYATSMRRPSTTTHRWRSHANSSPTSRTSSIGPSMDIRRRKWSWLALMLRSRT